MSLNNGRQNKNHGNGSDTPANNQVSDTGRTELQAFIQESQRRWQQYERDQTSKSKWEKATTFGVWLYTLMTLPIVYFAGQQFIVVQDQGRAQLRPYVVPEIENITPIVEGQPVVINVKYKNIGSTPVYQGRLTAYGGSDGKPFFITTDDENRRDPPACDTSIMGATVGKEVLYKPASHFSINKDQISLIMAGTARLVYLSRYCYSDIFREVNWVDTCIYWKEEGGSIQPQRCNERYNQSVSNAGPIASSGWWPIWMPSIF